MLSLGVADQDVAFAACMRTQLGVMHSLLLEHDDDNSTEAVPMIVDPAEAGNFQVALVGRIRKSVLWI